MPVFSQWSILRSWNQLLGAEDLLGVSALRVTQFQRASAQLPDRQTTPQVDILLELVNFGAQLDHFLQ